MTARPLVVFDLDGTLIDSRRDLTESANLLVLERGGERLPEAAIAKMIGEGAALLVRRALTAAGLETRPEDVTRFLEIYGRQLLETTRSYPGIEEALQALAPRVSIAVLTNKPIAPAREILEGLRLAPLVATVFGGDGPHPRKPDPASMRVLMDMHGVGPERTVLVGDTRIDFETARAAGTHVCLARYGFGYEQFPVEALTGREALVDHATEIPAAVWRLLT